MRQLLIIAKSFGGVLGKKSISPREHPKLVIGTEKYATGPGSSYKLHLATSVHQTKLSDPGKADELNYDFA